MISSNSSSKIDKGKNDESKALSLSASTPNLNTSTLLTSPIKTQAAYKPIHYSSGTRLLGLPTPTIPPEKRNALSNPPPPEHKSSTFWGDDDIESTLVLKEAQMLYERTQIREMIEITKKARHKEKIEKKKVKKR